jgi:cell shape-determining protein MreC
MTFQIKHTKQSLFGRNFIKILLIFLAVFIFFLIFYLSNPINSLVSDIFSPFFKAGGYFYKSIDQVFGGFSSRSELVKENENLSNEIENNRLDLIDYESLKYENQKLRESLKIKPTGDFITAAILARPPQIPLDSLLLNNGTENGLNDGDLVLAGEKTLIGKIVKLSRNTATVALNSFAGVVSYGYIARTNEPLEIKGDGGGSIGAKVPINFDVVVGDKLMVSNSSIYMVATVGSIEEDQSSGFKNVLMSLPVDISKINTVFVVPFTSQ